MNSEIICGLDLGSSKIRAVIGRVEFNPSAEKNSKKLFAEEKILGFAETPVKGFSKSIVTNISSFSDAIEDSISKAETMAQTRVRKVITNVSGTHIRTFQSRGSVHIADRPIEITKNDVARCIDSAKFIAMSLDREAVHLIPVKFFIDDKLEIDEPIGLFGSKLDVNLNIITSLVTVLQNLTKAVNLAGYEVDDLIVSGAGTMLAIFEEKDLEEAAILIDIGKEVTEITFFVQGKLRDSVSLPFGGDDLTQVLQDSLKIMFDEADGLKIKYGAIASEAFKMDDTQILMPSLKEENVISRKEIGGLLSAKVRTIMGEIYSTIQPFLKDKKKLPLISLCGGVSRMDGFVEITEGILGVPVFMGSIKGDIPLKDISFATALGLVRHGVNKAAAMQPKYVTESYNILGKTVFKIKKIISEYF